MYRQLLYIATNDADDPIRQGVEAAGWRAKGVADIATARRLVSSGSFNVGLIDLGPFSTVLGAVEDLCVMDGNIQWIALVSPELRQQPPLRRLIHDYCFDFHTLPADPARLSQMLGHAAGMAALGRSLSANGTAVLATDPSEPEMVGVSDQMRAVFETIRRFAAVDVPVLISGESGTGKELAARAIFERSRRSGGPFIAVNCAALPASLIQAELFGHEKGAFTGALRRRKGSLELANGGVVFLDEIGDLALEQQANLLRFLQEGTLTRVGGREEITVDARVVAATNVDLEQAVAEGRFREDLYYRLNVLRLTMPALRDRREDIPVLAKFFFERFAHEKQRKVQGFSRKSLELMSAYDWPGNIRELINRVRRALVMCDGRLITPGDLDLSAATAAPAAWQTLNEARRQAELAALRHTLAACNGNLTDAARRLGTSRPALYRLLDRHRLNTGAGKVGGKPEPE